MRVILNLQSWLLFMSLFTHNMEFARTIRIDWTIAATLVIWGLWKVYQRGRRPSDLPPGPPMVPVLGNLTMMPKKYAFLQMTAWAREYGEIFSLIGGSSGAVIVLSSPRAIHEVLERQAPVTSDRPPLMVLDIIFKRLAIGACNYNAHWKAARRIASEILSPKACNVHIPLQTAEARQLLFDTLRSPEELYYHLRRVTMSSMVSIIYGQRAPLVSSPFVTEYFNIVERFNEIASLQTTHSVQSFPILHYVPERWAPWKAMARGLSREINAKLFGLLSTAEERLKHDQANGCYMETMLGLAKERDLNREKLCYISWSLLNGGISTAASWLHFFALCMAAYPDVQAKAQAEIDSVIGNDRTPQLKDMESLPYVQALMKEVSRFRPVIPMNMPHVASSDLMYGGYRIPSGSLILTNIWGVFHDEKFFARPDEFDPERYIKSPLGLREGVDLGEEDAFRRLNSLPWGCGRRICPGMYLAQQMLTINVMNLLWGFDLRKPRSPVDGSEIDVDLWGFSPTSIIDVLPFVIDTKARSKTHAEIIERDYLASTEVFERFERELSPEDLQHVKRSRADVSVM